jgi:hypothetical protein
LITIASTVVLVVIHSFLAPPIHIVRAPYDGQTAECQQKKNCFHTLFGCGKVLPVRYLTLGITL